MQGWILVLGLALRGMELAGYLITSNDAMRRQVVSLPMCVMARCVPLAAETLSGAWLYHRVQFSHVASLDWVEASDGCCSMGSSVLVIP